MSWGMNIDIYSKQEGSKWVCEKHSVYFDTLKMLCSTRGDLEAEPINVDKELRDLKDSIKYKHNDFQFAVYADKLKDFDSSKFIYEVIEGHYSIRTTEDYLETLKTIQVSREDCLSENKINMKYVYTTSYTDRGYSGKFYNISSFNNLRKDIEAKYNDLLIKKHKWTEIQTSIDYLKLNAEERSNVAEEFEYIDEDFEDVNYKLSAVNEVIGIIDFFTSYDKDIIVYIYES